MTDSPTDSPSPSRFSFRTFTGALPRVETMPGREEAPTPPTTPPPPPEPQPQPAPNLPLAAPRHPEGSATWVPPALPYVAPSASRSGGSGPAVVELTPGRTTGGIGVIWQPLEESPFSPPPPEPEPEPSQALVSTPLFVSGVQVQAPPFPEEEIEIIDSLPLPPQRTPQKRRVQWWDVAVGALVVAVVAYLALAGVLYASRLWQARQTNSVTLLQDLGHGGTSQVTVLFGHNHLTVTEIDQNDPQRVTILTVNEAIVLSTDKTVLEAWFQAVLQPSRLDLVIQIEGGLDWPPYHPQFTTILVNNVAAIQKDPHAPGLRAPTTAELQQALHVLGT
jgi:hypothetical protein